MPYDADQLANLDAELDALSTPTSAQVLLHSRDYDADFVAASAVRRALAGGAGGPPSGTAGGVLGGTYPNPSFAADMATQAELDALSSVYAPLLVAENIQTASYTLALTDAGKVVVMNVGGGNNLTIPTNGAVAFPIGTTIEVFQLGAGQTTLVVTSLTSQSPSGKLKLTGQYSSATLRKRDTDTWAIAGDLSA